MTEIPFEFDQRSLFEDDYEIVRKSKVYRDFYENFEMRTVVLEWDNKYFYLKMRVYPQDPIHSGYPYLESEKMQLLWMEVPKLYQDKMMTHARMHLRNGPFHIDVDEEPVF